MQDRLVIPHEGEARGNLFAQGVENLANGLDRWRLSYLIGLGEIRRRYARSRLGQFWLTLSTAIMVGMLGLVWSVLWKMPLEHLLPYIALSLILWTSISGVLGEAPTAFVTTGSMFINQGMSFSVAIYGLVFKHALILLHNLPIIALIWIGFSVPIGVTALLALPGLLLLLVALTWVAYLIAIVCLRFRDLAQVVQSALTIAFYVTPVLWKPEQIPSDKHYLLALNPFRFAAGRSPRTALGPGPVRLRMDIRHPVLFRRFSACAAGHRLLPAPTHLLDLTLMARIVLRDVTIDFPIFSSHTRSVRTAAFSRLGGRLASHNDTTIVRALHNISLELNDGDRLGLVGHNGAGKTTFLRVVSGVYPALTGTALIEGRVSSFTDITLGMEREATGWQNIIFRCVFLGLTFAEAEALAPSIGEFSELGEYLDLPVRTYSSGMFVRLAFAISTSVQPDIVVMDEMIGAGDKSFIDKARKRIEGLLERARILVIASHNEPIVRSFCNKVLWLEKGQIKHLGPAEEVLALYYGSSSDQKISQPANGRSRPVAGLINTF